MHIREFGGGSNTILLLHGAPSPADDMARLAETLAVRFRVLLPDLPGYGKTSGGDLSYPAVNARLVDMLDEQGARRLHGIVGYSGGVFRALLLLLRGGIAATHLVALAGVAGFDPVDRDAFRGFAEIVRNDPANVVAPAMVAMMGERMLSPSWRTAHPADVARIGTWLRLLSPDDMAAELAAGAETEDLRPVLAQLSVRVHARVGELDLACPVEKSRALVAGTGGSLDIVPGCGHALFIEDEPATIAWVEAALA